MHTDNFGPFTYVSTWSLDFAGTLQIDVCKMFVSDEKGMQVQSPNKTFHREQSSRMAVHMPTDQRDHGKQVNLKIGHSMLGPSR